MTCNASMTVDFLSSAPVTPGCTREPGSGRTLLTLKVTKRRAGSCLVTLADGSAIPCETLAAMAPELRDASSADFAFLLSAIGHTLGASGHVRAADVHFRTC